MTFSLGFRPRAIREAEAAVAWYARINHDAHFLAELDVVLAAVQAMPRRFPQVHRDVHRAFLRQYPYAVFFRIRHATSEVIVLAVFPQRGDPARWPVR